jgi:phage-related protein
MTMKPLKFIGSSLDDLCNFPAEARQQAGFELFAIQKGRDPSDWKPMPVIGSGVREIRIHVLGEWRVIYVARFADAVYVLHAFRKRSQKTRREDIDLARQRYRRIEE